MNQADEGRQLDPNIEQFEAAAPPTPPPLGETAARGVGILVGRTLILQILTAGVTILLARILTPADFGLFAIALAVQLVGQRAAELGLPASLVRMETEPGLELQRAVSGFMWATTSAVAILGLVVAFLIVPVVSEPSKVLQVVAVALIATPFYAARGVPLAMMERRLRFGQIAIVETVDTLVFNAAALVGALLGFGAFSLSGAVAIGGFFGMLTAWVLYRVGRVPVFRLRPVLPHFGFGIRVSALQGVVLLTEFGLVAILASFAGPAMAGFYAMARRLFSFPLALAGAVARVSFPALSRDPELRPSRGAKAMTVIAIVAGLPLALVAGAAQPLIGVLIGETWITTADIVITASPAMMLMASVIAVANSYLMAEGRPSRALVAATIQMGALFLSVALLIDPMGEIGVGIALTFATLVGTTVLLKAIPALRRPGLSVARTTAVMMAAIAAGQAASFGPQLLALVTASLASLAAWLLLSLTLDRAGFRDAVGMARPLVQKILPR